MARLLALPCGIDGHRYLRSGSGKRTCDRCLKEQTADHTLCLVCNRRGRLACSLRALRGETRLTRGALCRPCAIEFLTGGVIGSLYIASLDWRRT
ncbi:MAG: hypothetical protein ACM3S1_14100 [Hyphomicrobiales bacterium]